MTDRLCGVCKKSQTQSAFLIPEIGAFVCGDCFQALWETLIDDPESESGVLERVEQSYGLSKTQLRLATYRASIEMQRLRLEIPVELERYSRLTKQELGEARRDLEEALEDSIRDFLAVYHGGISVHTVETSLAKEESNKRKGLEK